MSETVQCPHGFDGLDIGLVTRFLFPAPPSSYSQHDLEGELLWVPLSCGGTSVAATDDYVFPCLLLPCTSARYLVIYFHRNAEDLGSCRRFCEELRDRLHVHVFAVEYPGYGPCPKTPPSVTQATKHADAALAFVRKELEWPLDSILILGCSVGSGLATALAARVKTAGLVLVAPLLSVRDVVKDRFSSVMAHLITEQFPNDDNARKIESPTLIVHGRIDAVIPHSHGQLLYERLSCKKMLVSPEEVGHNTDILRNDAYLLGPMVDFFGLPDYSFRVLKVPRWALRRDGLLHRSRTTSRPRACPPVKPSVGEAVLCADSCSPSIAGKRANSFDVAVLIAEVAFDLSAERKALHLDEEDIADVAQAAGASLADRLGFQEVACIDADGEELPEVPQEEDVRRRVPRTPVVTQALVSSPATGGRTLYGTHGPGRLLSPCATCVGGASPPPCWPRQDERQVERTAPASTAWAIGCCGGPVECETETLPPVIWIR